MMNLELVRYAFGDDSTLSKLYVNGDLECFGLEDERREVKVYGETCIPLGTYEIQFREEGGRHQRYADRFPELHRGMLWLQDVPGFEYIYIHIGNKESHTLGCILVGQVPICLPDGEFEVARSTDAYIQLYRKIVAAKEAGERVVIHVVER